MHPKKHFRYYDNNLTVDGALMIFLSLKTSTCSAKVLVHLLVLLFIFCFSCQTWLVVYPILFIHLLCILATSPLWYYFSFVDVIFCICHLLSAILFTWLWSLTKPPYLYLYVNFESMSVGYIWLSLTIRDT